MFDLKRFINKSVTFREDSLFQDDINANRDELCKKIYNKTILVIGGAGSIGSSYIEAILPYKPLELVVVDINENALAELTRNLRSMRGLYMPEKYITYPMSFSSSVFKKMFVNHGGFEVIANFSAHKHVRSEKDIYSIEALLRNNVIEVKRFMDLLKEYPPEEYFCVSTDKAANPVNIMGASKRIMEDLIFSYSKYFPVKTARFANVAFSNGSLPAGFLARIAKLQPLSAPSDVKRYFVSPEESGQICMLACMLGKNREIFFPKLGKEQMISFDFIATELLHSHGYDVLQCNSDSEALQKADELLQGSKAYPVYYSQSDTSGEKSYEEFFTEDENVDMERMKNLGIIVNKALPEMEIIDNFLCKLEGVLDGENVSKESIVDAIKEYLPNFYHIEKGKSLDSKM